MTRKLLMFAALTVALTGTATAQEVGAGRVEIGSALFGVGALFMQSTTPTEPKFNKYVFGGAATFNFNGLIGVEADLGLTLGQRRDMTVEGALRHWGTPNLFSYSGSLVYSPIGSDRRVAPYIVGGVGAWTIFDIGGAADLGLTGPKTYLTGNAGGGVRWFMVRHWGVRADYRHILINNDVTVPLFGPRENRHANRVYGALEVTF